MNSAVRHEDVVSGHSFAPMDWMALMGYDRHNLLRIID